MQVTTEHIQQYDANRDAAAVYELWQTALANEWPLSVERMNKVLAQSEPQHFVARVNNKVVGFVATFKSFREKEKIGHLGALFVSPEMQGQGVGTALHVAALDYLRSKDLKTVQLGSTFPRFWYGIPTNLAGALVFFRHQGWEITDTAYDLVQDLINYTTPSYITQRMEQERITIAGSTSDNVTDVLSFIANEFPNWLTLYERCADLGDYRDLLVARDHDDHVVGSLIMYSPTSHPERTDVIWQDLLGEDTGALGAVGVALSERKRGIGIALVARASEILKERHVQNCYIDWVKLTDFYAKAGYEKWREFYLSWLNLA
jgi:predicted N-acetyltransferase YhbS